MERDPVRWARAEGAVRERTGKGRARTQGKAADKEACSHGKGLKTDMWEGEGGRTPVKGPDFLKVLRELLSFLLNYDGGWG